MIETEAIGFDCFAEGWMLSHPDISSRMGHDDFSARLSASMNDEKLTGLSGDIRRKIADAQYSSRRSSSGSDANQTHSNGGRQHVRNENGLIRIYWAWSHDDRMRRTAVSVLWNR